MYWERVDKRLAACASVYMPSTSHSRGSEGLKARLVGSPSINPALPSPVESNLNTYIIHRLRTFKV